ncbi:proteasome assembly chaperone 4 [Rosa sericea]
MAHGDSGLGALSEALSSSQISKEKQPTDPTYSNGDDDDAGGVQITCFTELVHDSTTLHFQIIRLPKQIYAWIGCSSGKLGHLYAAAPTRPSTVSVTSILGGSSDNTGSGIARRLVSRTGLNIILACNIPKNNPMIELDAEKLLVQKLLNLGYVRPKSQGL